MNCFNHRNVTAVAICKNCNKALCPECLKELKNGIACKATCVEEVEFINSRLKQDKKSANLVSLTYYRNAAIFFVVTLLFFYAGIKFPESKLYTFSLAGIFLLLAFYFVSIGRNYKRG